MLYFNASSRSRVLENPPQNSRSPLITSTHGHYEHPPHNCISRPSPWLFLCLYTWSRNIPPRPLVYNPRLPRWPPSPHPLQTHPLQSQQTGHLQSNNFNTAPATLTNARADTVGECQQHKHVTERGERGTVSSCEGQDEAGRCGHTGRG